MIGTDGELDLTNLVNSETGIDLAQNSSITHTEGALILKYINLDGYSLTLNQNIPSFTAENIWLTNNWDSSSSNYMSNTGIFKSQGVDITLTKPLQIVAGRFEMDGGTLILEQGGENKRRR